MRAKYRTSTGRHVSFTQRMQLEGVAEYREGVGVQLRDEEAMLASIRQWRMLAGMKQGRMLASMKQWRMPISMKQWRMPASMKQWRPTDKLWQGDDAAKLRRLEQLCLDARVQQQGNALEHGIHEIHPLEDPFPIPVPVSQQTMVRVRLPSTYKAMIPAWQPSKGQKPTGLHIERCNLVRMIIILGN